MQTFQVEEFKPALRNPPKLGAKSSNVHLHVCILAMQPSQNALRAATQSVLGPTPTQPHLTLRGVLVLITYATSVSLYE